MGKIIGVLSLKGGVGKTSSVVALGDAMADFGKKVLLVDGNLRAYHVITMTYCDNNGNSLHRSKDTTQNRATPYAKKLVQSAS